MSRCKTCRPDSKKGRELRANSNQCPTCSTYYNNAVPNDNPLGTKPIHIE